MWAAVVGARRRIGYRGAALLVCGVGWINYGLSLLDDPRFGVVRGVSGLTRIAPITAWGWIWIGSGILSCGAALLPARHDAVGWLAASAMPAIWAVAYTGARAVGAFPQGAYSGITWAVTPSLLIILAAVTRRLVMMRREVAELRRAFTANPEVPDGR